MTWENEKPEDQNLQALRNEMALENIMSANILTSISASDVNEGQMRFVYESSTLYLYTKYDGSLYRVALSEVS